MKNLMITSKMAIPCVMIILAASCTSPEEKGSQMDTTVISNDTTGTDTITSTGSTSGDNSTGTDTTDTKRQKATRQAGNH